MFEIKNIDESYNHQMLSILESAPIIASGLKLYFDKSPDIFEIPGMKYSNSEHLGFFLENELKGFASLGYFDALMNEKKEQFFTFYNFYLKPEARGKLLAERAMKEFFSRVSGKTNFGIAITMKGNKPVEAYVGGNRILNWMPPIRIVDELVVKSILFSFPKKNNTAYSVRNARFEDIPEMVKLLYNEYSKRDFGIFPTEDSFQQSLSKRKLKIEDYFVATDKKGAVKGVCLAWDCTSFRRTKVLEYSPKFYPILYGYKALENVLPMAPFPSKGENFNELTITDYAVENRDVIIMNALLSEIYHRNLNRKYHFMNFASCQTDELLKAAKGFWHQNIVSHILYTSFNPQQYLIQPQLPYIYIAYL